MERNEKAKEEVITLVMQNLGKPAATAFSDAYFGSTMPIFVDTALSILSDLIGDQKARQELTEVLIKYSLKGVMHV